MKICIPTMGNNGLDEQIGNHFGRSPTYTIIDTDTDQVTIIQNTSEHMGGMGLPAEILSEKGIDVLICMGLGRRAIMLFAQYNIKVFTGAQGTVKNAYDMWKNNQLSLVSSTDDACKEHAFRAHDHEPGEGCH
jgi:predicted Fe-Mo cluster-binding NifX family protein